MHASFDNAASSKPQYDFPPGAAIAPPEMRRGCRWLLSLRGKRRPKLIGVAIFLVQALTTTSRNSFDPSVPGHDIKDPSRPHQHASDVRACRFEMGRTHRFDQVAGAEASHPAWPFGFADWEPTFVYIAHLSALPA